MREQIITVRVRTVTAAAIILWAATTAFLTDAALTRAAYALPLALLTGLPAEAVTIIAWLARHVTSLREAFNIGASITGDPSVIRLDH